MIKIVQVVSSTCPPCQAIQKKIQKWLETHPDVEYESISIEEKREQVAQMGILSVPAVLVYRKDREIIRKIGYFSLDELLSSLDSLIG